MLPVKYKNMTAKLEEIEAGEKYELTVNANPPWPNGALRTDVTVRTGVKEAPNYKIRVYGQLAPRLRSMPSRFTIPYTRNTDLDLSASFQWSGGEAGTIMAAAVNDPKLSVEISEKAGRDIVVLHVPQDYVPAPGRRLTVNIKTDDKEAPSLRIPVYAARKPQFNRPPQQKRPPTRVAPTGKPTVTSPGFKPRPQSTPNGAANPKPKAQPDAKEKPKSEDGAKP